VEGMQRELVKKVNLRDIIPIIKKNSIPLEEEQGTMKGYIEESL
jgi:hypothetical protein